MATTHVNVTAKQYQVSTHGQHRPQVKAFEFTPSCLNSLNRPCKRRAGKRCYLVVHEMQPTDNMPWCQEASKKIKIWGANRQKNKFIAFGNIDIDSWKLRHRQQGNALAVFAVERGAVEGSDYIALKQYQYVGQE
jgi:hypothetical protein